MERIGLAPGSEVGGYRIVAPLGSGGMGTVYRAVDGGGTVVALKLLHAHIGADPVARDRLRREVAALQRLHHPAVAAILDAEADSTEAFVVTELIEGLTLEEHVRATGALTAAELARLADGLRGALEAVHAAGVVHRDLKPSNVLLTAAGPVLIDFGIAQAAGDPRLTSTNLVVGTPGYLAPELLADAEPSAVTDWWGWAALLAYAATGREPFGTRPMDAVLARSRAGDVDVVGLGPLTAGALRAALDPDPSLRSLPEELVTDLEDAATNGDAPPPTQVLPATYPPAFASPPAAASPPPPPTAVLHTSGGSAYPGTSQNGPDFAEPDLDVGDGDGDGDDGGGAGLGGYVSVAAVPRVGSVLALGALAVAAAASYPGVTAIAVGAGLVVFRTVGSAVDALHARRERRGGVGRADAARAVAASPWHLVRALVALVPSALVGASVAVIVGGVLWWALGTEKIVVAARGVGGGTAASGGNEPWVYGAAIGASVLLGLLMVWFGPATEQTRRGARHVLAAIAPPSVGAVVLVVLALGGAAVLVGLLVTGHAVTWWPLSGAPPVP